MTQKFRLKYGYETALFYLAFFLGMLFLNFTMDSFEPFSLALLAAALACGLPALPMTGIFILAGGLSLLGGGYPFLVVVIQAVIVGGAFFLFERLGRPIRAEAVLIFFAAVLPFLFLYGQFVYGDYIKSALVSLVLFGLCFVFVGALRCLLYRAGRCRLAPEELVFCGAAIAATGIGMYNCLGSYVYEGIALAALLLCCVLLRSSDAVLCSLVFSLPISVCESAAAAAPQLTATAAFVLYAALVLAALRAGKVPAAAVLFLADIFMRYFTDYFVGGGGIAAFSDPFFYLQMLVPLIPCLLFALIPEKWLQAVYSRFRKIGEPQLTRASINRNRARVGERLFEISAAFKEIENVFLTLDSDAEPEEDAQDFLLRTVREEVCAQCEKRAGCGREADEGLAKLVAIGCAKGKVNLIDLPAALTAQCRNPSSVLFSLNKRLAEYRQRAVGDENAAQGRRMFAEQAHGPAEMRKPRALQQRAPFAIQAEAERKLKLALSRAGVLCEEALICGSEPEVYLTTASNISGERLRAIAEGALGFRTAIAAKHALTAGKTCWLLRRLPRYDAAFGIASATKAGETACGDTCSVIRIDERTFLCALSDGMGSGEYARRISDCAVSLIESFYRAGMAGETVLSTVNRLLSFNREESFACIDMATVNLDSGRADIVKIGSPLAFLLAEQSIEILEGDSLPLGLLDGVRPTALERTLADGNVLLFISDGITAAFGSSTDIADFLVLRRTENPQALADDLLAEALARTGGTPPDDMTAVAVRLFEQ